MPELPEIETIVRGLRARLPGARVEALALRFPAVFRGKPSQLAALEGARIALIERAGKFMVLRLIAPDARHWQLMVHLGMTGQLLIVPPAHPPAPHTHVIFSFAASPGPDNFELHFVDPRRFGGLALAPAPSAPGHFAAALGVAAGIEPLTATEAEFVALFYRRAAPIKNALLNQKLLRGLGNIYADESLFRAGIDPRAHALSRPRLLRLRAAVIEVLREAIAAGGSSISDYLSATGERGWFQTRHRVYGRAGQPCTQCATPIRRIVLAGRSAHFCPACQKR